jgi:hypothetical protein
LSLAHISLTRGVIFSARAPTAAGVFHRLNARRASALRISGSKPLVDLTGQQRTAPDLFPLLFSISPKSHDSSS